MINLVLLRQIRLGEWVAETLSHEHKDNHHNDDNQISQDLKMYFLDLGECEDDNEVSNLILVISLLVDEGDKEGKKKNREKNQKKKSQTSMSARQSKSHFWTFCMIRRYPSKLYMEKYSPSK